MPGPGGTACALSAEKTGASPSPHIRVTTQLRSAAGCSIVTRGPNGAERRAIPGALPCSEPGFN